MEECSRTLNLLLVEDNAADVRLIQELLRDTEYPRFNLVHSDRLAKGLEQLQQGEFEVILLDLGLPDARGIDTFRRMLPSAASTPVVVLTGLDDKEIALKAVQLGAQDYLVKGHLDTPLLMRSLLYAIERQRLQAEIQAHERERERSKSRTQFLEIMAHELRNPMAVVKAILTVIRVKASKGERLDDLAKRIRTAEGEMDRISRLLDEVLDAFRAEKERLDFRPEPINLVEVVESALEPFRAAERTHQFLRMDRLEEAWVLGDFRRLEQVMYNLLENALKYSPNGGAVTVSIDVTDRHVCVSVADEGLGVPEDQLKNIFDAFYRANNVTPYDLGGLGLGLFICRAIVEDHGGEIWVDPSDKAGSIFTLKFPLLNGDRAAHGPLIGSL